MNKKEAVNKLVEIAQRKRSGEDYEKLKKEAKPYLELINEEAKKIAKKFGKKHYEIKFTDIGRFKKLN
jgi:hypothetical protein